MEARGHNKMKTFKEYLAEGVSSSSKDYYQFAHGKQPKGVGSWMFSTVHPSKHKMETDDIFSHHGSFAESQRAAISHYKMRGHKGEVHVLT